jgi:hypothetical protein
MIITLIAIPFPTPSGHYFLPIWPKHYVRPRGFDDCRQIAKGILPVLWFRTTTESFNELGSSAASKALRNEVLFPTRQNLGEPTVDDFVKNAIG